MLRTLLTGLALSLPLAAMAQDGATDTPATQSPAPDAPTAPSQDAAAPAAEAAPAEAASAPVPVPASPAPEPPREYLPNLYDVTIVETWDTLNVRQSPDGKAKVIATLPSNAKGIELVVRDATGKWGKINLGEQTGWVALRFLKKQGDAWQPAALPQSLKCSGTEPFWSLAVSKSGMVFSEPDQPNRDMGLRKVMDRGIPSEPTRGFIAGDDKGRVTAFMRPQQCSDGMSDRAYGLAVSVILDGQDMPSRMLMGCCSIAR